MTLLPKRVPLFWQILSGITAGMALVGLMVFAISWEMWFPNGGDLAIGPRPEMRVAETSELVRQHGPDALKDAIQSGDHHKSRYGRGMTLHAVTVTGEDVSGNPVSESLVAKARDAYKACPDCGGVRLVASGGQQLLIFAERPPRTLASSVSRFVFGPRGVPLWLLAVLSAVAALAVAFGLAWFITRPVKKLESAVNRVSEGDFSVRTAADLPGSSREFHDLACRFDHLASTIEQLLARQQKLFHNVSHELRSPLARINCAVEIARRSPERTSGMLARIETDTATLDALVGDLLTYTKLNADISVPMTEIDLCEVVFDVAETASVEAETKGIKIETKLPEGELLMTGNGSLLAHAAENILRNAVRYSPPGGTVTVDAEEASPDTLSVTVTDQGPGIPEAELKQVFSPFVRGSGQATGTGYGLGLSIAQQAVARHGGTVTAENVAPHGLRMTVVLPKKHED